MLGILTKPRHVPEVDRGAADEAARIIQRHVEQEARNRRMFYLRVQDLCPAQKVELVQDLSRLFR